MGITLFRLLAAGGFLAVAYGLSLLMATGVMCFGKTPARRRDAGRALATLLFRPVEPDKPEPRARGRREIAARKGEGSAELPADRDAEP